MEGLHEYYNMKTNKINKSLKLNFYLYFVLCWRAEITLASSIQSYIGKWYYNMETKKCEFH